MSAGACRRCGEPMRLAHSSGTHPWCDPQVRAELRLTQSRRSCRRCSEQARELTDEGLCGWCRDRVAAWQRHKARRSSRPSTVPGGRPAPVIDLEHARSELAARRSGRSRSPLRRRQQDAESSLW